jgi:Ulp1 family protease
MRRHVASARPLLPQSKDAVTLTKGDLNRLMDDEFLNDSLVDFQLRRIQEELARTDAGVQ